MDLAAADRLLTPSRRMSERYKGQGRPLGFLVAWLMDPTRHASKKEHQDAKKRLSHTDEFACRLRARKHLEAIAQESPQVAALFRLERPPTDEERAQGGEPIDIPWR